MTAPLIGWRAWTLGADRLIGATGWPWRSRIRRAWCATLHGPGAPFDHCVCGLYAYKDRSVPAALATSVWGQVSLWGEVAIHESGYRAEWARIDRLWTKTTADTKTLLRIFPTLREDPDGGFVFLDDDLDAELQVLAAQAEWEGYGLETFENDVDMSSPSPETPDGIFGGARPHGHLRRMDVPLSEGRTEVPVPKQNGILTGFGVACPLDGYVELVYNKADVPVAFHTQQRKWASLVPDALLPFMPTSSLTASPSIDIRFTLPGSVRVPVGTRLTVYFATLPPPHLHHPLRLPRDPRKPL
jgi:hypothetical protein